MSTPTQTEAFNAGLMAMLLSALQAHQQAVDKAVDKAQEAESAQHVRPNAGALDSSTLYRMNSTAHKIGDVFEKARIEARDEALWLSSVCQKLLHDNDRLRIELERAKTKLSRYETKSDPDAA